MNKSKLPICIVWETANRSEAKQIAVAGSTNEERTRAAEEQEQQQMTRVSVRHAVVSHLPLLLTMRASGEFVTTAGCPWNGEDNCSVDQGTTIAFIQFLLGYCLNVCIQAQKENVNRNSKCLVDHRVDRTWQCTLFHHHHLVQCAR